MEMSDKQRRWWFANLESEKGKSGKTKQHKTDNTRKKTEQSRRTAEKPGQTGDKHEAELTARHSPDEWMAEKTPLEGVHDVQAMKSFLDTEIKKLVEDRRLREAHDQYFDDLIETLGHTDAVVAARAAKDVWGTAGAPPMPDNLFEFADRLDLQTFNGVKGPDSRRARGTKDSIDQHWPEKAANQGATSSKKLKKERTRDLKSQDRWPDGYPHEIEHDKPVRVGEWTLEEVRGTPEGAEFYITNQAGDRVILGPRGYEMIAAPGKQIHTTMFRDKQKLSYSNWDILFRKFKTEWDKREHSELQRQLRQAKPLERTRERDKRMLENPQDLLGEYLKRQKEIDKKQQKKTLKNNHRGQKWQTR